MFKGIIGRGHAEFSTARQQDAAQFLEWLLDQTDKAHHAAVGGGRLPPMPGSGDTRLSDLFSFPVTTRLVDAASGGVRYRTVSDRFLRLRIPTEAAVNAAEVAAAKAAVEVAAAAADAAAESAAVASAAESAAAAAAFASAAATGAASAEEAGGAMEPASKRPRPDNKESATSDAAAAAVASLSGGSAPTKAPSRSAGDEVRARLAPSVPKLLVPVEAALAALAAPSTLHDFASPVTGVRGLASQTVRLSAFPRYLWVVLNRYTLAPDWTPLKVDAAVPMPTRLDLRAAGLAAEAGWPAPGTGAVAEGERDLDALAAAAVASAGGAPSAASAPPPPSGGAPDAPDAGVVAALEGMGFPAGACARAALAAGPSGGVEAASEWLMAHIDDAGFADPYVPATPAPGPPALPAAAVTTGVAAVDAAALEMLCGMGFEDARARHALRQASGDVERAADWLFSHADDPIPSADGEALAYAGAGGGAGGDATASAASAAVSAAASVSRGEYGLVGFLSHMGNNTGSGHYVAHVHKHAATGEPTPSAAAGEAGEGGAWFLFNDAKVARSEDPPLELGYVYLYKRLD